MISDGYHGARWVRTALQVNPFGYKGKNTPSKSFDDEDAYNKALLDACEEHGIELLAITDHWNVETARNLIREAEKRGIVALPGFEANSQEGIHMLVIFEAGTSESQVNAAIGQCGVDPGCANGTVGNPFIDILKSMTGRGALVIPAHVNVKNSGLLSVRGGQPLVEKIKCEELHALAVTPSQEPGIDQEKIFRGIHPYDRDHPIAEIYADDVSSPETIGSNGASCWFKVSSPSLESLKLAVRTPETRVALQNPESKPRPILKEISWTGGYFDGVSIPLSSDLTALIGGRGTGKSTTIESLRFVLDVPPIGRAAQQSHDMVVEGVLGAGTVVRLRVWSPEPAGREYLIERSLGNEPVVKDMSGADTKLLPKDVVGSIEIFGQHELAELAGDSRKIAEMVTRFQGKGDLGPGHRETLQKLERNRNELSRAEKDQNELEEELQAIPRLEEQVKQYAQTGVAERLAEIRQMKQEEAVIKEAAARVDAVKDSLCGVMTSQLTDNLRAGLSTVDSSLRRAQLLRVQNSLSTLANKLDEIRDKVFDAIAEASSQIEGAKAEWNAEIKDRRDGHNAVLRKLRDEGLEPAKYLDTTQALESLKAKESKQSGISSNLAELNRARNELLQQLRRHEAAQLDELKSAVREANKATEGLVIVKPVPSPDRHHIKSLVEKSVSGRRVRILEAIDDPDFSTIEFVRAARDGGDALKEKYSITEAQLRSLLDAGEDLFRQIEECVVGHAVEVELMVDAGGGKRSPKKLRDLSKGQRATALLLLLLGASDAPLIIDQPEDDLDNRFVYDGVVSHLRKLKGVRQIIASTHNANVPVLGDAELIVVLEGDGSHGTTAQGGVGSLDNANIRSHVENVLEGGPAAFSARRHLYGF